MDKIGKLIPVMLFVPVIIFCFAGCARYKMVSITTDPNMAVVYVNGEESGITPLTKKLRFDDKLQLYQVIAKKGPSYRDGEATIRLEPKEETEYHIVLEKIEKTVRIGTNPNMATIYIDGVERGITPLTKTLRFYDKSKQYEIIAKKEGYREERLIIGFEPEDKKQYDLDLEKIETVSIELVSFEPQATEKGVKLGIYNLNLAKTELALLNFNYRTV